MHKLVLGAALVLTATSASWAQSGFNPGTVVSNVYQNPASGCGCGYGHGCCPPQSYYPYGYTAAYPYDRHRRHVRHSAASGTTVH
jgi:hypothetical protein